MQPEAIKDNSLMQGGLIHGAMMIVALLFGSVPVFISYRKIMNT